MSSAPGPTVGRRIGHEPRPAPDTPPAPDRVDVAALEATLSDWFERAVVLLSSGRTGLALLTSIAGFRRHSDAIWVPPYLSRCVLNALTLHTFPTLESSPATATLLYHQFGFAQRFEPGRACIEDLAHAFFTSATSGSRRWRSESAIFSLPKFFPTAGLAGGVVTESPAVARQLRERAAEPDDPEIRRWMREVFDGARRERAGEQVATTRIGWRPISGSGMATSSGWLDAAYELLFHHVGPDPESLAGCPLTLEELRRAGEDRQQRVELFRSRVPASGWPDGFPAPDDATVPFAIPYFGDGSSSTLERVDRALARSGIDAGIYHVDVARDMSSSHYRPCVLIPCHQEVPMDRFSELCELVRESGVRQARR